MPPIISVVVPTSRPGGLDVVCNGLLKQTLPPNDFELIFVDNLYEWRKEFVEDLTNRLPFSLKHHKPLGQWQFPVANYASSANTGIHFAQGKYILFLADYTFLESSHLEDRVKQHRKLNNQSAIFGNYTISTLPPVAIQKNYIERTLIPVDAADTVNNKEREQREAVKIFCQDLYSGVFDNFKYSVFEEEFAGNFEGLEVYHTGYDYPQGDGTYMGGLFATSIKNDSFCRDGLLFLNGFSEVYCGGHGYEDASMAFRWQSIGGVFFWEPNSVAKLLGIKTKFNCRVCLRSFVDNSNAYAHETKKGQFNNEWDLITGIPHHRFW